MSLFAIPRWRLAGEATAILALPLLLYWITQVSPMNHVGLLDPWIYLAYGLNYADLLDRFGATYYGMRFGAIAPLQLFATFLDAETAYLARTYALYLVALTPLYFLIRGFHGPRSAVAAFTATAASPLLIVILSAYSDGSALAFMLAAYALALAPSERLRAWRMLAVGALLGLAAHSHSFILATVPAMLAAYGVMNVRLGWRRWLADTSCALAGIAAVTVAGVAYLYVAHGIGDMFEPTRNIARWAASDNIRVYNIAPLSTLLWQTHLYFPFAALAAGGYVAWRSRDRLAVASFAAGLIATALAIGWVASGTYLVLVYKQYFGLLLSPLILGVAVTIGVAVRKEGFAATAWLASAFVSVPVLASAAPETVPLVAMLLIALAGSALWFLRAKRTDREFAIPVPMALVLLGNVLLLMQFSDTHSYYRQPLSGLKPFEIAAFRHSVALIRLLPPYAQAQRRLLVWYPPPRSYERHHALRGFAALYLWDYSRLDLSETNAFPALGGIAAARLAAGTESTVLVYSWSGGDILQAERALRGYAPVVLQRAAHGKLCDGAECLSYGLFEVRRRVPDAVMSAPAGSWRAVIDATGAQAGKGLQMNGYGLFGRPRPGVTLGEDRVFAPRTRGDHVATDFGKLPTGGGAEIWVRIRTDAHAGRNAANCRLGLQDAAFREVAAIPCYHASATSPAGMIAPLPADSKAVRIVIRSVDNRPIRIPLAMTVEVLEE